MANGKEIATIMVVLSPLSSTWALHLPASEENRSINCSKLAIRVLQFLPISYHWARCSMIALLMLDFMMVHFYGGIPFYSGNVFMDQRLNACAWIRSHVDIDTSGLLFPAKPPWICIDVRFPTNEWCLAELKPTHLLYHQSLCIIVLSGYPSLVSYWYSIPIVLLPLSSSFPKSWLCMHS